MYNFVVCDTLYVYEIFLVVMSKKETVFRFKRFMVSHGRSSMKIGVDAVLLGAWVNLSEAHRILDVGCGCGIIALMCAQRNENSQIQAIDIDSDSIIEANENFLSSPWANRLSCRKTDFNDFCEENVNYDLIISNPPFFDSGIDNPESCRLRARHQDLLSPEILIRQGLKILCEGGIIAFIMPVINEDKLYKSLVGLNIKMERRLRVRGHSGAPVKRVLLEFKKDSESKFSPNGIVENKEYSEVINLEYSPGKPTESYIELCKDFYLKF